MSSSTGRPVGSATSPVAEPTPALGPPLARLVRIGLARGHVELLQFSRERDAMVFIFGFPIILLLIFGSVFGDEIAPGVSFRQYFTAGMIASGLMITSFQSLAIQIAIERDDGTLHRLAGTPMPRGAFFLGKIVLVVVTATVQTMLLLLTGALLFDLQLPSEPSRWLTFTWLSLLGAATFTLLGIAASGVPRSGRSASAVISPIVIVAQFISGVFFVYNDLPPWMQHIAAVLPLKWLTQGMRSVFLPDSFAAQEPAGSWEHARIALVLLAWGIGAGMLAMRTFRWHRRSD
jgi:ABC-2 type transport system permease protein